ncbi:dihydropteroate synthase [Antarcticibacterium flavum]|uniref:dihydropteroate synthase n=1 Tax=Antarcticibacterium flavum TaxID=2058175 RepID=A0A5B7X2G2_9FLAO|nr:MULTISPECIES: dihydropteroate synthase [Antarcticibacterium]MCM4159849.1 dihydropteroate synthase [Antarcticibacterium sp. W02-3]QCY68851.1 dihydropteroate synthase [Antarcticibacterium flavum]
MTINCKGNLIDLSTPKVMGILNITPDSFFSESRTQTEEKILQAAEEMLEEGATFLDIGGYSSRPGANEVSVNEELERVIPAIESILKNHPETLISIDTFRAEVASQAIKAGAAMVNDIAAGNLDGQMMQVVGQLKVPYIMMHMRGTPQTMQEQNNYKDLIQEVIFYFSEKIAEARNHGINDVILDPGFGFSKNISQNFELLNKMELLQTAGLPVLAGLSRKSTIYKTLSCTPGEALNGTTVLNTIALQKGAAILRVHDVKEAMEAVELVSRLKN